MLNLSFKLLRIFSIISRICLLTGTQVCQDIAKSKNILDLINKSIINLVALFVYVLLFGLAGWLVFDVDELILGDDANFLNHILKFINFVENMNSINAEDTSEELVNLKDS